MEIVAEMWLEKELSSIVEPHTLHYNYSALSEAFSKYFMQNLITFNEMVAKVYDLGIQRPSNLISSK